jgi:hypothetical protein
VAVVVWPYVMDDNALVTLTVVSVGAAVTVSVASPVFPAAVATICVVPAATAVTTPLALTEAMADDVLLHVTAPEAMTVPF